MVVGTGVDPSRSRCRGGRNRRRPVEVSVSWWSGPASTRRGVGDDPTRWSSASSRRGLVVIGMLVVAWRRGIMAVGMVVGPAELGRSPIGNIVVKQSAGPSVLSSDLPLGSALSQNSRT